MKLNLLLAALAMTAVTAFADQPLKTDFLITVEIQSGFVMPDKALRVDCSINNDGVDVLRYEGQNPTPVHKRTEVDLSNLGDLVEKASNGTITKSPAPADIGNRIYTADIVAADGNGLEYDLGSIRDSQSITKNSAPEAETLKAIADKYCGIAQ